MSRRKKTRMKSGRQQGINFVITLVTLSIVFGFIGYLAPQYAIRKVRDKRQEEQLVALDGPSPVTAVPVSPPATEPEEAPKPAPSEPAPPSELTQARDLYRVQVGVFSKKANAERILAKLRQAGYEAISSAEAPYRVQTGAFGSRDNAENLAQELRDQGFEAIVVR